MRNNQTVAASRGRVVLCLLATAACSGEDPDPRAIAMSLAVATAEPAVRQDIQPAVASFFAAPANVPAAPSVETASLVAPPRRATLVVGHAMQAAFDEKVRAAFLAVADLDGASTPCTDRDAIEWMMQGRADFAVVGCALSARDQHAGLRQTRLGVELFALAVPATSPVRSLTSVQVRKLLTGEVSDWSALGHGSGPVSLYVPAERERALRAAKVLIPGDGLAPTGLPMHDDQVAQLLQASGAIGVVRVGAQPVADGLRLLQIDWSPPTAEAYAYGTYPYGVPATLVTSGQPAGAAQDFLAFARSEQGRALLGRTLLLAR